jgi:uncharacterized delta-60 repeat protein
MVVEASPMTTTTVRWRWRALVGAVVASLAITSASASVLDTGFGGDGRVRTRFPGGAYANAVAVGPHGGLVVVGAAAGPDHTGVVAVARYTPDGVLVGAFGEGGRVETPVSPGGDEANAVALTSEGKIVVAGTAGQDAFAVVRYLPDGRPDASFGVDGIVTTDVTVDRMDTAHAVIALPGGRIVAVGTTGPPHPRWVLVRYRPGGALDPSFGDGGIVITSMGIWGVPYDAVLQPDGRVVVGGTDGAGMALARYRRDGSLDTSFGQHGKVRGTWPLAWIRTLALQPDGRILAAGDRDIFITAVARFTSRGVPDPTFGGGDGRLMFDVGASEEGAVEIAVLPDGRIVGAGGVGPHEANEPQPFRFVAFRLRPRGVLDRTFDGDGYAVTRFGEGALAGGGTLGPAHRLTVVGTAGYPSSDGFALVRYVV